MKAQPRVYPLDYDALAKGEIIQAEQLIEWKQVSPADGPRWNFALLSAKEAIEAERTDLVARIEGDTIRILSDAEADEYLDDKITKAVRSLGRAVKMRTRIDRSDMSDCERRLAESRDRIATATYFAASKARREQRQIAGFNRSAMLEPGEAEP